MLDKLGQIGSDRLPIVMEAYKEADSLEQSRKGIVRNVRKAKLIGSCDLCSLKPSNEEMERLKKWWHELIESDTSFKFLDLGPIPSPFRFR